MNDLTDAIAADSCGGPRRLTTSRLFAGIGILCFLLAAASPPASAQYDDLLKRLPRGANSVVVIDAKALLGTELAVREGWAQKRELKFRDRPISIPPEAEVVAIGAQLDPSEGLRRQWELAVMRLSEPFPMQDIARSEGGYIDTFGTTQAAWTPSNAYFVDLDKNTLGIMYPADRQYVARWAKFAATNKAVELSDYLQAAAKQLGPKTQIVMALDLADVVQPHRVQEALEESAEVKDLPGKPEQYTPLIASIRGVTLTIGVSNRITGSVRVDFDQPVAPLGKHAKPLFLEALDRFQARIPDLDRWTVSLQEKSIVLEGTLTTEGARRIGSLVEIPTTKFSDLKGVEPAKPDSVDYVKTSQGYYRSVTTLINDLRKTMEENRHRDYHALWMERYGRKIDALPILNVDEELVAWGANVAETFRSTAIVQKSSGVRQGVRKSQVYGDYQYAGTNAYGNNYYSYRPESSVKTQINREEQAQASAVRFENFKQIEDATADVRRKMTLKYGVEF
jgi:hypothetical protein